ncbi:MAG: glycosyltransferase family 2 protein, partial [Acidobacteriota bacterium]
MQDDRDPMNPLVSILVLNYNGQAHLEPCFTSLAALDYPPSSLELVLVDNASADDSLAYTRSHFPHVTIIQHPQNYGFCRGYNLAAQAAQGEYLVFLNNDTHVDPGYVRGLLEPIQTFQ